MKKILFFFYTLCVLITFLVLFSCKGHEVRKTVNISKNNSKIEKIFNYDLNKTNWLTVKAVINNKDTGIFVLDNGTVEDYTIIFDKDFAVQNKLIPDNKSRSLKSFQDSSFIKLSFGPFTIDSKENQILELPKKEGFKYSGIIGLGFLKKYVVEINYIEKYFLIDSTLYPDTSKYYTFDLEGKNMFKLLPVSFYLNEKKYIRRAILDLGYEGEGFYWGGGAAKNLKGIKINPTNIIKEGIASSTGEISRSILLKFDSVSLNNYLLAKNINSRISISNNGISGSGIVLFGNSFLSKFSKVYIDFRKSKLYVLK